MKIWIKIALVILTISLGSVEIFQIYSVPIIEKEIITLQGEQLKAAAAAVALNINGDIYKTLDFENKSISGNHFFKKLRSDLLAVKSTLMFEEEIYTLNFVNDSLAIFGIMTNDTLYTGETLHLTNTIARNAYNRVAKTGKCTYTGVYQDKYGKWISGIAPIFDSQNKIVGMVQSDHRATIINKTLNSIKNGIFIFKIAIFFLVIILSIFISKMITNPIKKVTYIIKQIANGNYENAGEIKGQGELKELINSTDLMRRTIVAQQDKIFRTIDDLKEMNERLKKSKEKAEESDKLKSEFLAMISHEIRTPINVLLSYTSLIKEELNEEQLKENEFVFAAIQKASWRLIRSVELIIMTAEFQTGSYDATFSEINLGDLIKTIYNGCKLFVDDKAIDFSLSNEIENSLISADEYSVKQMFSNLIDNAIKFTNEGSVKIKIYYNEDSLLAVDVSDTGIGISEEYQQKLYNVFSQEQQGYTRKFDGNGLGLSIVKKACEMNNAVLTYTTKKNSGTTFTVTFMNSPKKSELK